MRCLRISKDGSNVSKSNSNKKVTTIVSVVVVTKNSEKYISKCLESLFNQNFNSSMYEIIVVDGGSCDNTLKICKDFQIKYRGMLDLKIIKDPGGSIGHSRNVGVCTSRGKYVAFIDSDCVAEKEWLSKLVKLIDNMDERVVAVGGPNLVPEDSPPLSKVIGFMQESFFGSGRSPQSYRFKRARFVYSLANCNAIYRRHALLRVPYDNSINIGEDCDLNFRLLQKGYKLLFVPDVIVWHYRPERIKTFMKKMFSYGYAMARIHKKYRKIVRWYAPIPSIAMTLVAIMLSFSLFIHEISMICLLLFGIYAITDVFTTLQVLHKYRSPWSFLTMLLLPLQHACYAVGFLVGIIR